MEKLTPQETFTPPLPKPNKKLKEILVSWLTLAPVLTKLTQEQVMICIIYESRNNGGRKLMMERLLARYTRLENIRLNKLFNTGAKARV